MPASSFPRWDGVILISLNLLTHAIISGFNFILQIKSLVLYVPYRFTCSAVLVWSQLNLLAAQFGHTMGSSSLLSHGPTDGSWQKPPTSNNSGATNWERTHTAQTGPPRCLTSHLVSFDEICTVSCVKNRCGRKYPPGKDPVKINTLKRLKCIEKLLYEEVRIVLLFQIVLHLLEERGNYELTAYDCEQHLSNYGCQCFN